MIKRGDTFLNNNIVTTNLKTSGICFCDKYKLKMWPNDLQKIITCYINKSKVTI